MATPKPCTCEPCPLCEGIGSFGGDPCYLCGGFGIYGDFCAACRQALIRTPINEEEPND